MYRLYLPGYIDGVEVLPTTYSPGTASTTGYPVPGTTYKGFMWTRMLDIGQCMTIKQEGEYKRQEKGVNCTDPKGSHRETKKSIGRVYTK